MIQRIKSRLIMIIIGSIILLVTLGGGSIALAQAQQGNGAVQSGSGQQRISTATRATQSGEDQHLEGIIQSIDNSALTFVLLPDGQTQTVTISFDHQTNIEREHEQLDRGSHVLVEVLRRSDGTLYATEIKPVDPARQGQKPGNAQENNDGDNDHGNDDNSHHRHGGNGGRSGPDDND